MNHIVLATEELQGPYIKIVIKAEHVSVSTKKILSYMLQLSSPLLNSFLRYLCPWAIHLWADKHFNCNNNLNTNRIL